MTTPAFLTRCRAAASPVLLALLSVSTLLLRVVAARVPRRDDGMSTAEYAVGTVAAVAFAALLYKVVRSGAVQSALSSVIEGALGISL